MNELNVVYHYLKHPLTPKILAKQYHDPIDESQIGTVLYGWICKISLRDTMDGRWFIHAKYWERPRNLHCNQSPVEWDWDIVTTLESKHNDVDSVRKYFFYALTAPPWVPLVVTPISNAETIKNLLWYMRQCLTGCPQDIWGDFTDDEAIWHIALTNHDKR